MDFHRPEKQARQIRPWLIVVAVVVNAAVFAVLARDIITRRLAEGRSLSQPQAAASVENNLHPASVHANASQHRTDASASESFQDSSSSDGLDDSGLTYYEPPVVDVVPAPEQKDRPLVAEVSQAPDVQPTAEELKLLAAQVSYEANRRLEMLARTYQLSQEQQALAFPVLARASKSYDPALPIEGEDKTDAYLHSLVQSSSSSMPDPLLTTGVAPSQPPIKDYGPHPAKKLIIEPFLDPGQKDQAKENELDTLYWWKEVLDRVSGQIPVASQPAAHQGGNLFDLLNQ